MMNDVRFRYVVRHSYAGDVTHFLCSLDLVGVEDCYDIVEKLCEEIDPCTCSLNESNNYCDCDTILDYGEFEIISRDLYTGLTDRKGVDVYEGDILKMYHQSMYEFCHVESTVTKFKSTGFNECTAIGEMPDVRIVRWVKGALMLHCNDGGFGHAKSFNNLANPGESYEVIGNIHQNPELINA